MNVSVVIAIIIISATSVAWFPLLRAFLLKSNLDNEKEKIDLIIDGKRVRGADLSLIYVSNGLQEGYGSPMFIKSLHCVFESNNGELYYLMLFPTLLGKLSKHQSGCGTDGALDFLEDKPEIYEKYCKAKS